MFTFMMLQVIIRLSNNSTRQKNRQDFSCLFFCALFPVQNESKFPLES